MKKFTTNFTLLLVALLSVVMLGSTTAFAVTKTSVATGSWNTAGTWTPAVVPANGDTVIIAAGHNVTVNASTNNIAALTVNSTGTLTIGSSTTARTVTVTGSVTNNGTITANSPGGAVVHTLNIGGNFTNNGTFTAVAAGTNGSIDVFFNGTVAQSIGGTTATAFDNITISNTTADVTATNNFSILGTGLMSVPNNATFNAGLFVVSGSGAFTLAAGGTLGIGDPNGITPTASGTGATAGSIRTLTRTFTAAASYIYNGSAAQVTGSGLAAPLDITINNAAGVTLTGTAGSTLTATGQLTMTSGALNMANINLSVAALTGSGNLTHTTGTTGARTLSITGTTSPAAYTGVISNGTATSVALTKSGAGTLTLSGLNSYTGLTTISAGTIKLGAAGDGTNSPLGTTAAGTIVSATGAALDLNGFTLSTTEALTLNGTGVSTAGALTNSSASATSYSGLITLGSASTIATSAGDLNVTNVGTITGATFGLTLGGSGNGSVASIIGTTSGTVTKSGTGTWTLSGSSTYTGLTTISVGTLKLGAAGGGTNTPLGVAGAGSGTVVSATGAALDLNGFTLGTAEALSLNGTGVSSGGALTNSSASAASYSGLITLGAASSIVTNAGDINVTNAGTITGAGNLLTLGGSGNGSVTSIIGNTTGGVTKSGIGAWTLSGVSTYSGATTISSGTLKVGVAGGTIPNASAVTVTGTLDLNGNSETIGSLAGAGAVTSSVAGAVTLTTGGDNSNTSYSGVISDGSGTVAVTKAGTGTWTVSGLSSYTGLTTISAGTVIPGAAGDGTNSPFGTIAGATTVSAGAMLDLNGVTLSTAEPLTLNGTGITSAGALASTNPAAVSYSGLISLGSASSIVASSGTISITNTGTITGTGFGLTLDGAGNGSVTSIIGTGAGALTKAGAGTWTLSGPNTYTGVTTLSAGVLSVGTIGDGGVAGNLGAATNAATNLVLGTGTLQYTGSTASTNRNFTLSTGTTTTIDITNAGTNLTISGASTATTGALTKIGAGTLTLSGANLYTGLTTLSAGTLAYGASNALSGAVTVNAGTFDIGSFSDAVGTVTLVGGSITGTSGVLSGSSYAMQSGSVSAILGGAGALTKTTAGTVTLSGLNTYTGATTISAGTLSVNTLANSGSSSSLGTGSVTPTISMGATGILKYTGTGHSSSRAIATTASGATIDASGSDTLKLSGGVTGTADNLVLAGTGAGLESGAIATTTGTLTKSGTGSWSLTGTNTYTGVTTAGGGVLVLGSANALPGGIGSTGGLSNLTINGGVVGLANGNFLRGLGTLATQVQWLGTGGFAAYGADRVVNLGNAAALATWNSGSFVLTGDTLVLSVPSATNMIDFQNPIAGTVARTILVDNQAAAIEGKLSGVVSGTGSFVKLGSGLLQLSGTNTFSGGTTLSEGTLTLSNTAALGAAGATLTINAGTLDLATNTTVNAYATTVNGAGTIVSNRSTAGAGVTHTLGTLSIGLSDTLNVTRGSAATGIAGLTFGTTTLSQSTPVFNTADSVNLTLGAVGGAFAMTKQGVGKMTLATTSTRTTAAGITNLNAGILRLEIANALNTLATAPLNINGGTLSLGVTAGATYGGTAIAMGGNGTIESDRLTAGAGVAQVVSSVATNAFQLNVTSGSNVTSGTPAVNVTGTLTVGSGGVVSPGSTVVIGGAAGTLTGTGTAQVTKTGAADDFTTQYTINTKTLTNLTIEYAGGAAQTLNNALVYNGLKINNAAGVTLGAAKTVNGALTVASGTLTTGANVITLGTSATLSEAAGQTVLGNITTTKKVTATSGTETFGNIGSDITLHGTAPDTTTITRKTGTASTGGGNNSIKRYFDISPKVNTGLNADLVFHYDDSELNGQTEASLLLYKSTNTGSTWSNQAGTVNTANNTISVTGLNDFSRWTASALSLADNYTLNITAVNGSVAKNPDQGSYTAGTSVQLTATPATGYHFVNWTGDTTSSTNPLTVTLYSNKNITANFAINTYTLTISATNGSVGKAPDQATYDYGTSVQLTATADPGYHFWKWTGDTSGTTNPLTITMSADKNITANFILDAVTKNWTGATSTDWNNAANWSPAEVPSSDDPVTIFSTTNKPNVNANGASAAIQIFSGGRLDFNTAGTTLTVNGNFEMIGGSTVSFGADATLDLKANLQTDHNWFPSDGTQGTVRFSGAGDQLITGEPFPIKIIEASSGGALVTFVNVDVDTLKMLSNNFQLLDNGGPRYIKVRGDIVGAGASRYIMTTSLSTGGLTRVGVGSGSPVLFPVGTSNSYNPFSIQTGTGTDDFTVRVINSVSPTSINNASAIQRTWSVTEATPGGNGSMTAAFTWNGSEEGGSINVGNRTTIASWRHDGSTWAQVGSTTVTGSGPYTATTSGLTNFSNYTLGLPGALSYTITASAGAHGSIAPAGITYLASGANQSYTVTADAQYHIDSVFVDGGYVGAGATYDFTNVTANHTINAVFVANVHTITSSAGANGSISPLGATSVNHGDSQSFTITPNTNYHVANVLVDGSSVGAVTSYNFTNVIVDHTISATFAIDTYTITAAAHGNGTIDPSGAVVVNATSNQSFTIAANANHHIDSVVVDGVNEGALASRTFTNVLANHTIDAYFSINTFTLTYTAGANGSITGTTPQAVNYGTDGSAVTAVPDAGYHFVNWSDASTANPRTDVNVTADISVTANFAINTYTLTYTAGAHGSITGITPQTVNHGSDGSLVSAVADAGYHFVNWSDASTDKDRTDVNVQGDITVTANFAINTYTITATAGANGSITPSGAVVVNHGSDTTFTITPATGYHIDSVFVDGAYAGAVTSHTFTNVVLDGHSISAKFAINTYTLTYTAGANGSITGATPQTVNYGTDGSAVTAVPAAGYHFVNWSDASTSNPRTDVNVTGNISVTANFAINTYTLTYTAGANGSITGISPQTVNHGADGSAVTAVPATGYHFVNWSDASTANPRTDVNVTADISVTANFAINTYTLTYTAGANGSITGTTPQTVNYGTDGSAVTAVPAAGYHFVNWSDASTSNPRTDVNVTADISVTANFAINTYTLTYTAGAHGSLTGTSPQTVNHGSDGSAVTAVPDAGYHFLNWSDASTSNPRTDVNVQGNISVTANFAINTYTITATAGANGSITPSGAVVVNHGSDTTFTITPATGYHIDSVFVDGAYAGVGTSHTFTNVVADGHTISATFAINTYTLTYTAGANGSITGTTPQTVNYGTDGSAVTAVPAAGYHFVNWSDASTANPRTDVNVQANISVTANFAINTYTLTYAAGAHGSISGTSPQTVNHGADGSAVTAVPDAGYHFVNWSDASTSNPRTDVNVTADISVTANFAINTYTITATAGANGSITPSGSVVVNYGTDTTFTITPATGYHILDVVVDGSSVGAVTSHTFTNVVADGHTISATFAINTYTLNITAVNGSVGKVPDQATYDYGTSVQLTATGASGYHLLNWSGDASGSTNPLTVVMDGNKNITANFIANALVKKWKGTVNSDWNVAGNWEPAEVPSATDTVSIEDHPNNPNVNANATCDYLQILFHGKLDFNTPGVTLTVNGNFDMDGFSTVSFAADATLDLKKSLQVDHNWFYLNPTMYGTVRFSGTGDQVIHGEPFGIKNIEAASGGTLVTFVDVDVDTIKMLSNNFLLLDNGGPRSITVHGDVVGAGSGRYVVTNGTGGLKRIGVGSASPVSFPVGTSSSYNPFSIQTGTGTDDFTVRVINSVSPTSINNASAIQRTWSVTEATPGGNGSMTAAFTWNGSEEGGSINAGNRASIASWRHNGSTWAQVGSTTVTGSGPYTATTSGLTNFSNYTLGLPGALSYTITASAGANGSIAPAGISYLASGGSQSYTITADAGYHIADVQVDGGSVGPVSTYDFTGVTSSHTISATFAPNVYAITASAGANGAITPSGSVTVNAGTDTTFTFTPNTGYHVDSIFVDGVSQPVAGSYTFTNVTATHTIHVNFAINTYTITASAGSNGSITPSGAVVVNHGSDTTFTIAPATGYHIDSVFVDGAYAGALTSHTFTNVVANGHTISVKFTINTYTLTYTAGTNGSISGATPQTVNYGADGSAVTAVADPGYHFVNWSDASTANPRTDVGVTANISVTANFAINTYTLTYTAGANGSISGTTPQTVNHGADGSAVTAVADPGYHFVNWSDASTANPRTDVNVTANISVTANFAINTYTITASAGSNGSITPSGAVVVNHGSDTTFTIAPASGYHIDSVFVDGAYAGAVTSHTFTNVVAGHTISVKFAINTYTLTYTAGANGSITGTTPQTVNHGADGSAVTAVPAAGYHFVNWSDASTANPRTDVNVTANISVTANFAINTYTLTYTAGANGSITGTTPQTVNHGADGSAVTAVADPGYHFVNWSDASTSNPRTDVNVQGTISVTANFAINTYTLTYTAGANGSITGTTPQTVNHGADGSAVTAVPAAGYHFVNWSDASTANPRTDVGVTANISVTANFAINSYTLTYTAGANGSITGTTPQTVNHGADGSAVTAVPAAGYHFVNWSDASTANPRTDVNVTANISVTANFAINSYTLTYTAGANGSITGTTPQTVNYGADGSAVTAVPAAGYHFVNWSDASTANPRTDVNVQGDISVTANFAINTYTLTYTAGANGSITGATPQTVNYGADGSAVTAVPAAGYHFVNWSDASTANPRTDVNVTANISVTANFAINSYTLTYTAGANGSITGTTPQTVNHGADGSAVTAVADAGYHFVNWSDASTANPRTDVNVQGNISVTANFAINTYTITASAGANGSITPSGAVVVNHGSDTTFTIAPTSGYHIDSVFVDGAYAGAVTSHTFTNVVADGHTINVKFAINTYTLTYTAGANGSITGTTPQTVNYGSDGSAVTAVPAAGYHFVNWSDASTANPRTDVNVTANISVTANFAINTYTLTYTAGANGSITGTTPQTVNHGADGSAVTAVPAAGYHFVNWSDASTANPRTDVNVQGNISVTANFAINTYTLTYTAGANGSITGTTPQTVNHGADGSAVTAVPAAGYHFVNWSDASTANPRTDVNVQGNISVTANFAINTYTLTYTAGANGSITGTTPQTVNHGADGSAVTAVPAAGYHFVNWSDASTANPRTDVNVQGNISVTANFAINTYTLTYTAGANGSITGTSPQTVNHGADGSAVTAVPAAGYHFVNWSDASTANPRTDVNVTADISVTANFAINTYTLTYTAGANGSITGTTPQTVNHGADGSAVTAVADAGYHFVNWSDASTANPRTDVNVTANISVTANFAINTYTLTYTAGANGSITGTTPQTVNHGADGSAVTAVPAAGYHFVNWSDASTANPRTDVNVTANISVTANFAINTYTLTYTAGANGSITGTTPQTVNHGADGSAVTAVADAGYHFVNWSDASTANPRTDVNVTANISVTANFAINTYTLTYTAGANGSITGTTPQTVNHGADGSAVTAVPAAGYHFVNWSDASTANPRTDVNVTANISVTANFAINTYTLTYTAGANGSITGTTPQTVNHGADGSAVTAVADAGYHFVNWSDASTANPRTDVNVTADISVTANFAINTYTLTYTAGANGSITGTTPQTVNHGADGSAVTAVPAAGYHFVNWSDTSTANPRTDVNVTANISVTANFAINTYTLTYTAGANGSITGTTPQTVNHGADGSAVTAVPAAGYHFVNWSDASTANPRTDVNVTANISVTANFAINTYTITSSASANGQINPLGATGVNYGGNQSYTITVNTGYHIDSVVVDGVNAGAVATYDFTNVTVDHTIGAYFSINSYTITASAGANGTIAPAGVTNVNYGDSLHVVITPAGGYQVATLKIDGVGVVPSTSYTFTSVAASHTIAATFTVASVPVTATGTTYTFDNDANDTTDMTMNFSSLTGGGGSISVTVSPTVPPSPPAGVVPYYLEINSTIPNHTFSATTSIDMFGVAGFGPSSYLMYYSTATTSWVMVSGTYLASDVNFSGHPSFTFTTDHFTTFAFINTASTPKNVYVSSSATSASPAVIYPNTDWTATGHEPDDWAIAGGQTISVYLVPEAGAQFGASDITLEFPGSNLSLTSVSFGTAGSPNGLYSSGQSYPVTAQHTLIGTNRVRINATRLDNANFTTAAGDYIAKLTFTIVKPGHTPITVIGTDFRFFNPSASPSGVYVMPFQAEVKAYLGDIAAVGNTSTGDGKVDFNDLAAWSLSYWSGTPGFVGGLDNYKVKYDFGPTQDHYVFSLPVPDTKIDFEDLVIFAISYGLSSSNQLPRVALPSKDPVEVSLGEPVVVGNETRIPVKLAGSVNDVRGMKLEINGQFGSFLGVEKGSLLQSYTTPVMLLSRANDRNVYVDFAIVGLNVDGINEGGEVVWLRFSGDPHVRLSSVEGRTSNNSVLNVAKTHGAGESVPTTYNLMQNYPNPFNPTTTIQYEIPTSGPVSIEVYGMLGERVATLVNTVQEAGFYQVQWNGRDDNNNHVASGVYLYRINAGKFSSVKKMLFLK